jgi:hypothetical protein
MDDNRLMLSVTVNSDDSGVTEKVLAQLEPYREGKIERTRDFGVSIALAASVVTLAKAIVDLWRSMKTAPVSAQSTAHRAAITVEARDGAVLSLSRVNDEREIQRFLAEHAGQD